MNMFAYDSKELLESDLLDQGFVPVARSRALWKRRFGNAANMATSWQVIPLADGGWAVTEPSSN